MLPEATSPVDADSFVWVGGGERENVQSFCDLKKQQLSDAKLNKTEQNHISPITIRETRSVYVTPQNRSGTFSIKKLNDVMI